MLKSKNQNRYLYTSVIEARDTFNKVNINCKEHKHIDVRFRFVKQKFEEKY